MKKKLLWCAGIIVLIGLVVLGVLRYVEVRNRQTDPIPKAACCTQQSEVKHNPGHCQSE